MNEIATRYQDLWPHLFSTPLISIALTLSAYFAGSFLFRLMRQPIWCPTMLLASLLLASMLAVFSIDYKNYQQGATWLTLMLGPVTVALGVPLYRQLHHIRAFWKQILVTLPIAAALAAIYALLIAKWAGASTEVLASVVAKSVTAPIAISITEQLGGSIPIMMGGLLITGVVAVLFVELLAKQLNIKDERIIGLVLGINGHAIGTVRAFEMSAVCGAFASLGMGLTGIFSALFLPLIWTWLPV
ncbi:MAG: LrgB family protein [Pontibacterium sp.]